VEEFEVEQVQATLPLDFNVAPTKDVYAVVERRPRPEPEAGSALTERQLRVVRWGLVPSWADGPSVGSRLINARVESAGIKRAYRRALLRRRCLLPADGYYEWHGSGGRRQPFFIRPVDGAVLAMAGLYELWYDARRDRDDPQAWLWTAAILTTAAEPALASLHDRMPLVMPRERYDAWLDPGLTDPDAVRTLLAPPPAGRLEAYPVSAAVGDVRSNGRQLIERLTEEQRDATLF